MSPDDLKALRIPLIVLVAVLLAGAAAIYQTDRMVKAARQELAQQRNQLKDARTRLQKSGEERDVIVRFVDAFRQLERAGFIGEEQRINWLDSLRIANQQTDLFGIEYQIETQKAYPYAADLNPGAISLNQSLMRLRFRLLHEEDLTRFLNSLARQGGGIFNVDRCSMRRIDTGGVIRYQPNVAADCDLSWITAKVGAKPEPKKP
jgi:hypothetical protein